MHRVFALLSGVIAAIGVFLSLCSANAQEPRAWSPETPGCRFSSECIDPAVAPPKDVRCFDGECVVPAGECTYVARNGRSLGFDTVTYQCVSVPEACDASGTKVQNVGGSTFKSGAQCDPQLGRGLAPYRTLPVEFQRRHDSNGRPPAYICDLSTCLVRYCGDGIIQTEAPLSEECDGTARAAGVSSDATCTQRTCKAMRLTFDPNPITYGDTLGAGQLNAVASVQGGTISYSSTTISPYEMGITPGAGTHTVTANWSPTTDDARALYDPTSTVGSLVVNRKSITCTADSYEKTEADPTPALTFSCEGVLAGDRVGGRVALEPGATPNKAGSYKIVFNPEPRNPNYVITAVEGRLTVKADVECTCPVLDFSQGSLSVSTEGTIGWDRKAELEAIVTNLVRCSNTTSGDPQQRLKDALSALQTMQAITGNDRNARNPNTSGTHTGRIGSVLYTYEFSQERDTAGGNGLSPGSRTNYVASYTRRLYINGCSAEDGACGAAAKEYESGDTAFQGALCASGSVIPAAPVFPAAASSTTWTCASQNGGASASCSASRKAVAEDGVCGPAAKLYRATDIAFEGALCLKGQVDPVMPEFPLVGHVVLWNCLGENGGLDAACSARVAEERAAAGGGGGSTSGPSGGPRGGPVGSNGGASGASGPSGKLSRDEFCAAVARCPVQHTSCKDPFAPICPKCSDVGEDVPCDTQEPPAIARKTAGGPMKVKAVLDDKTTVDRSDDEWQCKCVCTYGESDHAVGCGAQPKPDPCAGFVASAGGCSIDPPPWHCLANDSCSSDIIPWINPQPGQGGQPDGSGNGQSVGNPRVCCKQLLGQ